MSNDLNLKLTIRANADELSKVMRDSSAAVERFGQTSSHHFSKTRHGLESISAQLQQTRQQFLAFVGIASLGDAAANIIKMADDYTSLEAKLKLVTKSQAEYNQLLADLTTQANANRASLTATADLYSGIAPALQQAGKSQQDILNIVDSVQKALVVGGSTAQGSAASILQLTQALGAGVLRGDEFNSIMENGRGIAMMLADALGVNVGELRKLAEQGKLTADVVTAALLEQNAAVTQKFQQMPMTVGQAVQIAKNNLLTAIGELDNAYAVSEKLAAAIVGISNNLEHVGTAVLALAGIYAAKSIPALSTYIATQYSAITADMAKASATRATAIAEAQATTQKTQLALLSRQAAAAELASARANLAAAQSVTAHTAALARMQTAQAAVRASSVALVQAKAAEAAATASATATTGAATVATTALANAARGLLAIVGGIPGLLVLAGGGLYYLKQANDEARQSVELANGVQLSFADSLQHVTKISDEYRTASQERQQEIRNEIALIIEQTQQRKIEAQEQLNYLASIKADTAANADNMFRVGLNNVWQWAAELVNGSEAENKKIVAEASDNIKRLMPVYTEPAKGFVDAEEKKAAATGKTAKELLAAADSTSKAAEATKAAIKVQEAHGNALKAVVESLQKQRVELEHGKLAAEYFTHRLNGLTDAEARAAAGASQYNTYLQERQRLQEKMASLSGSVKQQAEARYASLGLSPDALSGIDQIRGSTDKAVASANAFKQAIDAANESAKAMANTIPQAMTQSSAAIGNGITTTAKANSKLAASIQREAAKHAGSIAVIDRTAAATGTDANLMKAMAYIESKFNANAKSPLSSASGLYQFINSTAKAYGIAGKQFDAEANARAYAKFLADNKAQLQRYGIEASNANLYLAHQQGSGGLKHLMDIAAGRKSMDADTRERLDKNGGKGLSAGEFLDKWRAKYNEVEASVVAVFGKTQQVATATAAVVDSTAKTTPIWETINASTAQAKEITVEYNGVIDSTRMTAQQYAELLDGELGYAAAELLNKAKAQRLEASLTGAALREQQLRTLEIGDARAALVLQAEQEANYTAELAKLQDEAASNQLNMATRYTKELEKQNLSQAQIADIVQKRMAANVAKIVSDTTRQTEQLRHTAQEWERISLAAEGYNAAQIAAIQNARTLYAETQRLHDMTNAIGDSLLDALIGAADGGTAAFAKLKNDLQKTFSDFVIRPTIAPLSEAVSRGLQGMMQGQANPWSALQAQFGQTWQGLQQDGTQGYMNAAGIGAAIGSLTGSQAGAIGGAMGSAAGKALGTALGGPVGGAIGSVIGSVAGSVIGDKLFKDDDSPRAHFTGGNPADGYAFTDRGKKLYASSTFGTFGFQADGTHDLGEQGEKQLEELVKRMAAIDDAIAKFIPAAEIGRIKQELSEFQQTGLDFDKLVKERLRIIAGGLSETMRGLIDFSGDADSVIARINELIAIQQQAIPALRDMGLQIGATADAALAAATGLADAAGGLQNLTSLASTYYDIAYTEEERKQRAIDTAKAAVAAFNAQYGAQIDSISSLRQYIESLDMSAASSQQAAIAAMGLASGLRTIADSSVAAAAAASELDSAAAASELDSANAKLSLQNTIGKLFSDELSSITRGLDSQLRSLESSYREQSRAYEAAKNAAGGLRDAISKLSSGNLTTLVPVKQLEAARDEYNRLRSSAAGGDVDAAKKLEQAGETLLRLSREYNASNADYSRDFDMVKRGWESVANILESQRDPQDDMLAAQRRLVDSATSQITHLATIYGGIIGGNNLLSLIGKDIDNLPPDIANALKSILDGLKPNDPKQAELTKAEYRAKALDSIKNLPDQGAQLATLYQVLFNRAPDAQGFAYWLNALKSGFKIEGIIDNFIASDEFKKVHPNSHATGLARVPYDEYPARLHKDEAVIDAQTMFGLRKYGIPVRYSAISNQRNLPTTDKAVIDELRALRQEVAQLRAERSSDALTAMGQRDQQLAQTAGMQRDTIRALRMRGAA